jgi:hypothetical protein
MQMVKEKVNGKRSAGLSFHAYSTKTLAGLTLSFLAFHTSDKSRLYENYLIN